MSIKKVLIASIIITLLFAFQDGMAIIVAKKQAHLLVPQSAVQSTPNTDKADATVNQSKPATNSDEQSNTPSAIVINPHPDPDGYSVSVSSVPAK